MLRTFLFARIQAKVHRKGFFTEVHSYQEICVPLHVIIDQLTHGITDSYMYRKVPSKRPLHSIRPPTPQFGPKVLHRFIVVCSKQPPSLLYPDRDKNGTCVIPVLCTNKIISECIGQLLHIMHARTKRYVV